MIYSISDIKSILARQVAATPVRQAILFGSYAKGQATEHSDVDLLVDSGLQGLAFYGLLEEIATTLYVPVDLIDMTQVEQGSQVDHEIQRSGVAIYEQ